MSESSGGSELQKALEELQQYLSDQLAPLMVVDSIGLLMEQPPDVLASAIQGWILSQHRRDRGISTSDYLYHGIVKIQLMQEYKLLPAERFEPFLRQLKNVILNYCPPEERDLLRSSLENIHLIGGNVASPVEVLFKPPTQDAPATVRSAEPQSIDVRRFGFVIRKLEKRLAQMQIGGSSALSRQDDVVSEALAEAARSAGEAIELKRMLDHMHRMGIPAGTEDVFRALGKTLAGWNFPEQSELKLPEDSNLQAMHRIVSKAPDPQEAATRFHQLVRTAVERFNEGFLPQSVSIIGLAEKIIIAKEVDGSLIEIVRSKGDEQLDPEQMRKYAENSSQHTLLRKIFNFFSALTPTGLFESLRREPKRERRKLYLLLLECHGEATRTAALDYLRSNAPRDFSFEESYFRRNLIYLLRRIPAPASESLEQTVDLVLPHAELGLSSILIKETLAYLSQLKHEKVERFLEELLSEIESMLLNPQNSAYESSELLPLLDRVVSCLCRMGTHQARKAVVEHASKKKAELGNPMGRLTELGSQNLGEDVEVVDQLIAALKSNLPLKMLGVVLHNRDYNAKCIVEALAGTLIPSVRQNLEELIRKYPEQDAGRAAAAILRKQESPVAPQTKPEVTLNISLMGDVDLFGLPSLLQNFSESSLTGNFILKGANGETWAILKFYRGKIRSCRVGELSSDDGFFQLFETPRPGTFQFVRTAEEGVEIESDCKEVLPLVMEGIRRYDELQRTRIIIPDEVRLISKTTQPSPLAEEKNGLLFRDIWNAVQNGATPVECEAIGNVDSYRIRRLLVHWLDSGAIEAV